MKLLMWVARALFPNSRLANRPVRVSRKEYLALKREIAESNKYSMGETVKPDMLNKDGQPRPHFSGAVKGAFGQLHDSVAYLNTGKRLDGTDIEESKND